MKKLIVFSVLFVLLLTQGGEARAEDFDVLIADKGKTFAGRAREDSLHAYFVVASGQRAIPETDFIKPFISLEGEKMQTCFSQAEELGVRVIVSSLGAPEGASGVGAIYWTITASQHPKIIFVVPIPTNQSGEWIDRTNYLAGRDSLPENMIVTSRFGVWGKHLDFVTDKERSNSEANGYIGFRIAWYAKMYPEASVREIFKMCRESTGNEFYDEKIGWGEIRLPHEIEQDDSQLTRVIDFESGKVAKNFVLSQNYPNPFNPTTTIEYALPKTSYTTLTVYNSNGQMIEGLFSGLKEAGVYQIIWDASENPAGVYLLRLKVGNFTQTIKMILVK